MVASLFDPRFAFNSNIEEEGFWKKCTNMAIDFWNLFIERSCEIFVIYNYEVASFSKKEKVARGKSVDVGIGWLSTSIQVYQEEGGICS